MLIRGSLAATCGESECPPIRSETPTDYWDTKGVGCIRVLIPWARWNSRPNGHLLKDRVSESLQREKMNQGKYSFVVSFFLVLALSFHLPVLAQEISSPFPRSSPEDVGMSSERLRHVVNTVQEWVNNDEIVGAVMLVIRHDKVVLHEAVGWNDRENNIPMEVGNILQMRSMTKPLVGTAILMLMEEGRLLLDDQVSKYLPSFSADNPRSQDITIYQLLTHTSGIPGNDMLGEFVSLPGGQSTSLRNYVDAVGRQGPYVEPGTEFHYSDRSPRVLAALIEEISGMPADEFIQNRILDPLQMEDSFFNHTRPDDRRMSRVAAAYRGESNNWDRVFDSSQLPQRQYFEAAWGLFSTAMDYAKFMSMTLRGGQFGTAELLSPATVKLATSPHSEYIYDAASLRERWKFYGLHWSVLSDKYRLIPGLQSSGSFGHNGGQGTDAKADPQQDLIFVYLTQSRGHQTSRRFFELVHAAIVELHPRLSLATDNEHPFATQKRTFHLATLMLLGGRPP